MATETSASQTSAAAPQTAVENQAARLFRKSALDRLSSPEQLDQLIRLTRPRDWIAMLAVLSLIGLALAWSILGRVPERVKGSGILITSGGRVVDAVAIGEGTLSEILVPVGGRVSQGEQVARVIHPALRQQLENIRAVVSERAGQLETLRGQIAEGARASKDTLAARARVLDLRVKDAQERVAVLAKQAEQDSSLFDRRLITWQQLNETRLALAQARQSELEARSQMSQLETEDISQRNANQRDIRGAEERLADARRQLAEIEIQLRQQETILSPADGRVTEWKAIPGTRIAPGQPLLSVESGATGLELLLYLPPNQGKRVKPGMDVQIAPSTVRREEFGMMEGRVSDVSDFPSTAQAMQAVLRNDQLVQSFSEKGAPYAARISLTRDPRTASGFAWSGGSGPEQQFTSGSLAEAEVTVAWRRPISYVIPWLRKITGLAG
ncbi:NHLP bacteriocin system secretion protein [Microvirga tunisiensis]|uniref:NHLP bacteriocin system secretion protein n=1 Tax=Pannonibacter tanglangensis TaxID=2750084 RepID=A0A7X5JB12_9HYPH|nr:NHLP bacteriocin system secretion protein [Pannonibacter sp. XCT-53]NBN79950.1 NHLP bacteriocin system secretion protein [Pannonibacter sp. XCT-53]